MNLNWSELFTTKKLKSFFVWGFLSGAVIFGFFVRFANLGRLSLWCDESFTYLATEGILKHGWPQLPIGIIYYKSFPYNYLAAFSCSIFGLNELALRLPAVIFGTLSILLIYYFGKTLFNRKIGLLSAVILSLNYWAIMLTREARYYSELQFFYLMSLYFFWQGFYLNKKNYRWFFVVSAILASTSLRLGDFLFLGFIPLFISLRPKNFFKKEIIQPLLILMILLAGLFFFENTFWQAGRYLGHPGEKIHWHDLWEAKIHFLVFFAWFKGLFHTMFWTAIIGVFLILLNNLKNWFSKKELSESQIFLAFSFAAPLLLMPLARTAILPRYLYYLLPLLILLFSWAIFTIAEFFAGLISTRFKNILALLLAVILTVLTAAKISPKEALSIRKIQPGQPLDRRFTPFFRPVSIREDYRASGQYVKNYLKPEDLVIAYYSNFAYIYAGRANYRFLGDNLWEGLTVKNGRLIDSFLGLENIETASKLKNKINQARAGVWILTYRPKYFTKASGPRIFLEKNEKNLRFKSPDGANYVYYFTKGKLVN